MPTAVRRLWGQLSLSPIGVEDQSKARIRPAISLSPRMGGGAGRKGVMPRPETAAARCGVPGPWRRQSVESDAGVSACFAMIASAPQALGGAASASAPSTEISTITTDGSSSRIRRAASTPLMPGIRTSIRMRSGISRDASATASSPEAASPAQSNTVAGSSTIARTIRLKAS